MIEVGSGGVGGTGASPRKRTNSRGVDATSMSTMVGGCSHRSGIHI